MKYKTEREFKEEVRAIYEKVEVGSIRIIYQEYKGLFSNKHIPFLWEMITKDERIFVSSANSKFIGCLEITQNKSKAKLRGNK